MAVIVDDIIDSVATTLLDTAHRGWPRAEIVGYINEALAATANVKPDMYTVQDDVVMIAGVNQTIPARGVALIDISKNTTSGQVVTQVDASMLDAANRLWPAATQEVDAENFSADPRDPRRYKVTPPNTGLGSLTMVYGAVPDKVTGSSGEEIPVAPSYLAPLIAFTLGKCYAKNAKTQDLTKSSAYMNQWGSFVGMKAKAQVAVAPKVAVSEGNG